MQTNLAVVGGLKPSWMPSTFEWFSSGWLSQQPRFHAQPCKHLLNALCVIFVADVFAVYFKPLQGNTNGDIYHDIRKLCNDVFCRKETLLMRFSLVSMPRPLPSSPNSTWNCGQGCPNKNIYECMGKMITVLTIFLDSFSALFNRNRSESSFRPTNFRSV